MSAIGISAPRGKEFAVSAYADYRHDTMVFARQQSQMLRAMDWDDRVKPMLSYSDLILRGGSAVLLAIAALVIFV